MTPFEIYMRAMYPVHAPYFTMMETYAQFLRDVGQGRYNRFLPSNPSATVGKPSDTTAKPVLGGGEHLVGVKPVRSSFDPFSSWKNLAAFIPASPFSPDEAQGPDHSMVAKADDAVTPAKAMVRELACEAQHLRAELAHVEARRHELAGDDALPVMPLLGLLEPLRMLTDMFMTFAGPPAPGERAHDTSVRTTATTAQTPRPRREVNQERSKRRTHKRMRRANPDTKAKNGAAS